MFVLMVASAKKAGAPGKAASASSAGGSDGGALKAGVTRFLGRRDTEDYADRAIAEHFPQASKAAMTQARVGGKTFRERVIDARRSAKTSGKRMGALFWSELRSQYLSDVSSELKGAGQIPGNLAWVDRRAAEGHEQEHGRPRPPTFGGLGLDGAGDQPARDVRPSQALVGPAPWED